MMAKGARWQCALCGKHAREVTRMVAGQHIEGLGVCEECIYGAALVLAADGWIPPTIKIEVQQQDGD